VCCRVSRMQKAQVRAAGRACVGAPGRRVVWCVARRGRAAVWAAVDDARRRARGCGRHPCARQAAARGRFVCACPHPTEPPRPPPRRPGGVFWGGGPTPPPPPPPPPTHTHTQTTATQITSLAKHRAGAVTLGIGERAPPSLACVCVCVCVCVCACARARACVCVCRRDPIRAPFASPLLPASVIQAHAHRSQTHHARAHDSLAALSPRQATAPTTWA
jgi:hypothetical protein